MNPYTLTLISLLSALVVHVLITWLAVGAYLHKGQKPGQGRSWLALAIGSMLFTLHHGYTLELAMRTGLYDMRQAILVGLAAIFFGLGVYGFKRQTP